MKLFSVMVLGSLFYAAYYWLKLNKEVVFNIPGGFLIWMLLGGDIPPSNDHYAVSRCVNPESCPWLESNDVVISACMKCGTNWVMTLVHEIRTWNLTDLQDFDDILDISPWLELKQFPHEKREEKHFYWSKAWNDTRLPFKQYKSHLPPYTLTEKGAKEIILPIYERPDVKFLVVVRNPYDAVRSGAEFLGHQNPEWGRVWGGVIPFTFSDSMFANFVVFRGIFSNYCPPLFFNYWKDYKDVSNVLILHYTDIFKNLDETIDLVAKFVGVELPESAKDVIKQRVSVSFMKNRNDRYRHTAGEFREHKILNDKSLVNKGGTERAKGMDESTKDSINQFMDGFLSKSEQEMLVNGFGRIAL